MRRFVEQLRLICALSTAASFSKRYSAIAKVGQGNRSNCAIEPLVPRRLAAWSFTARGTADDLVDVRDEFYWGLHAPGWDLDTGGGGSASDGGYTSAGNAAIVTNVGYQATATASGAGDPGTSAEASAACQNEEEGHTGQMMNAAVRTANPDYLGSGDSSAVFWNDVYSTSCTGSGAIFATASSEGIHLEKAMSTVEIGVGSGTAAAVDDRTIGVEVQTADVSTTGSFADSSHLINSVSAWTEKLSLTGAVNAADIQLGRTAAMEGHAELSPPNHAATTSFTVSLSDAVGAMASSRIDPVNAAPVDTINSAGIYSAVQLTGLSESATEVSGSFAATADSAAGKIDLTESSSASDGAGVLFPLYDASSQFVDSGTNASVQHVSGECTQQTVPGDSDNASSEDVEIHAGGAMTSAELSASDQVTQIDGNVGGTSLSAAYNVDLNDAALTRSNTSTTLLSGGVAEDGIAVSSVDIVNNDTALDVAIDSSSRELGTSERYAEGNRSDMSTIVNASTATSDAGNVITGPTSAASASVHTITSAAEFTIVDTTNAAGLTANASATAGFTTQRDVAAAAAPGGGMDLKLVDLQVSAFGHNGDYSNCFVTFTLVTANGSQVLLDGSISVDMVNGVPTATPGGAWNNGDIAFNAATGIATLNTLTTHVNDVPAVGDRLLLQVSGDSSVVGDNGVSAHGAVYLSA